MAGRFLDSSAVANFYHAEAASAAVDQNVPDPAAGMLISRLSVVEGSKFSLFSRARFVLA